MATNKDSKDPIGIIDGFTEAERYDPTEDDLELLALLREKYQYAYDYKLPYLRQWELERRFLKGDQYIYYNNRTGEIIESDGSSKRLRSLNNQIRPLWRSLVGKLNRTYPGQKIRPATTDYVEVQGARVAEHFLEYFKQSNDLELKFLEGNESLAWCGNAAFQLCWDPDAGRDITYCKECDFVGDIDMEGESCPNCEADYMEAASAEAQTSELEAKINGGFPEPVAPPEKPPVLLSANEGDVIIKVLDVRDVFPEPGIVRPEEARYVFVTKIVPVTEVRRMYPDMAMFIGSGTSDILGRNPRIDDFTVDERISSVVDTDEHVELFEYHEKPSYEYPDGRVIVYLDNLILEEYDGELPELKRLPFFFFAWAKNPGEFWADGPVTHAWHRQYELNSVESNIREYVELLTRMKFLNPIGSRIANDEITATTGQGIKYNPAAGKPDFLRPPPMPSEVFSRREMLIGDMRGDFAVTATEQGITAADPNGRAMAIIEAESDQQIGPITKRNRAEWALMNRAALILSRKRYHPERQFSVGGDDTYGETYAFADMNLSNGWDLVLEVEDGFSQNEAIRKTEALEFFNVGAFGQPGTPEAAKNLLRVAKIKLPGIGPDLTGTEYAAARELIHKIEAGQPYDDIVMAPENDPMVFSEVLLGWLRGTGRKADPFLRQNVRMVWQYYNMWIQMGGPDPSMLPPDAGGQPQPGAGPGGPDQSAVGGTPNNPGHLGTVQMATPGQGPGNVVSDAQRLVGQADQMGEQISRPVGGRHES